MCRSRSLAAALCEARRVEIDGQRTAHAHHPVRVGATVTVTLGRHVRRLRVTGLGERRGPARDARLLFEELAPPPPTRPEPIQIFASDPGDDE